MLEVNPLIIRTIIEKARQYHAKDLSADISDGSNPADDRSLQILTDSPDDSVYDELKAEISDLEPAQQAELVALMWLGRGDYEAEEWEQVVAEAERNANNHTAEYLLGTPLLGDFLEEGLNMLGYEVHE